MAEREQAERKKKKNSPYCGGSSSSSWRCGASFICSDEVVVADSVVYVLGGSAVVLQRDSWELLEELAKLADGQGRVCSSRGGVFAKPSETSPTSSPLWHGTRGGSGGNLYEFALPQQDFIWRDNDLKDFV
jgi:hypothetical protein